MKHSHLCWQNNLLHSIFSQPQLSIWNVSSLQPVGKQILGSNSCCSLLLFATGVSSPSVGSVQLAGSDREGQDGDLGSVSGIGVIQADTDGCWNGSPGPQRSWASAQQNELSVGQALSPPFLIAMTATDPRFHFLGHCLP